MDSSPMRALVGSVDRLLEEQGVDASVVTEDDKLLLAAQYVETGGLREKLAATIPPEVLQLDPLFRTASRADIRPV